MPDSPPRPLQPISRVTAMLDACVYRHNPYAGEMLACVFDALKKGGVECSVLQDRFCLLEATSHFHELMLSEDIAQRKQLNDGSDYALREKVDNYLTVMDQLKGSAPVHYVQAAEMGELYHEKENLTQAYLLENPLLKSEWPKMIGQLRRHEVDAKKLNDDLHSFYTVCVKCAHTIEAIHRLMRSDPSFAKSLTTEDKKNFMLDKFTSLDKKVHWDMIDLTQIDSKHIPVMVVDAFAKTKKVLGLFGTRENLTPMGKLHLHKQADMGERVMERHAVEIAKGTPENKPPRNQIILLVTDDKDGLARFEKLKLTHSNVLPVTSRELATIVCDMAGRPELTEHVPDYVLTKAERIASGEWVTNSPRGISPENVKIGGTSFTQRILDNAALPGEMRTRLLGM